MTCVTHMMTRVSTYAGQNEVARAAMKVPIPSQSTRPWYIITTRTQQAYPGHVLDTRKKNPQKIVIFRVQRLINFINFVSSVLGEHIAYASAMIRSSEFSDVRRIVEPCLKPSPHRILCSVASTSTVPQTGSMRRPN